jgi:hypothetical protein
VVVILKNEQSFILSSCFDIRREFFVTGFMYRKENVFKCVSLIKGSVEYSK